MQKIHDYITDYGAAVFLYMLGFLFSIVVAVQMIYGQPTNTIATGYIGLVVGYAINSHGISQGVTQTNDTVAKVAVAQFPLTQESAARATAGEEVSAANSARITSLEEKSTP